MIVMEVESAKVTERTGVRDNGQPWKIRNQTMYASLYDVESGALKRYPTEIKIRLAEDKLPYAPGYYMLSPTSVFSDRYDSLALDPQLVPAEQYMKLTAAAIASIPKETKAA